MIEVRKYSVMRGHQGSIYALAANVGRQGFFYSAGGDGMVVEWNENDPENGKLVAKVSTNIFSMLQLHEQGLLLLGQMQGGIHVLDIEGNKEIKHLASHTNGVFDLQLSCDKNRFFSAGGDGRLCSWGVDKLELISQVTISEQSLRCIALHPELPLLAVGCSDNRAYILNSETFEIMQTLEKHTNSVFSLCFSPDGQWLLSGGRDAQLMVWNVKKNCEFNRQIPAHLFTINSIVYSPDGNLFATASRDKTVKVWDAYDFSLLKVLDREKMDGHLNSVNKLIWPDCLISCSDDRTIIAWNVTYKSPAK